VTSWALRCCQAEMCARLAVYTSPLPTCSLLQGQGRLRPSNSSVVRHKPLLFSSTAPPCRVSCCLLAGYWPSHHPLRASAEVLEPDPHLKSPEA
jgi:hypothetical protein